MLALRKRHNPTKRRRNFVPEGLGGEQGAKLEPRALAAPAIFRRPPLGGTDPLAAADQCVAGWLLGNNTGVNYASITGTRDVTFENWQFDWSTFPPTNVLVSTTIVSLTALVTADAVDSANTDAPAALVGNPAVALNTTAHVTMDVIGPDLGVQNNVTTGANVTRNYELGGWGAPTGNVTYMEEFNAHFNPPPSLGPSPGLFVNAVMAGGFISPAVNVAFGNLGSNSIAWVRIDGVNLPGTSGTGTIAGATGTISYSWSATDLVVVTMSPLNLGQVVRNPDGTQGGGLPWPVFINSGINVAVTSNGGGTSQTSISTHYGGSFL